MIQPKPNREAWLKGGSARCDVGPDEQRKPVRLVLLGPPGVGKGTQAELLSARLRTCHLSTGDIFRAARSLNECECTAGMKRALASMRRGELVSDETVLSLLAERLGCFHCGGGFLLDGFPRTLAQAEAMEQLLQRERIHLTGVIHYELPIEQIVDRLSGRRVCPTCQAVFHIATRQPLVAGICDYCGGRLIQREDDVPATIRLRMDAYQKSTRPLTEFYYRKGLLLAVPADGEPEKIFERTLVALQNQAVRV
jgi:adenylate kinase